LVIAHLTAWTLLIKRVENQQLQLRVLALALVLRMDSFEGSNSFSIPCSPLLLSSPEQLELEALEAILIKANFLISLS
jgi:hypothetical protein